MSKADNKMDCRERVAGTLLETATLGRHDDLISHNCHQHWLVSRGVRLIHPPATVQVAEAAMPGTMRSEQASVRLRRMP